MKVAYVSARNVFCWWAVALALVCVSLAQPAEARKLERYEDHYWALEGGNKAVSKPKAGSGPGGRTFAGTPSGPTVGGGQPLPWTPNKTQVNEIAKWKSMATPRAAAKALMNPVGAAMTLVGLSFIPSLLSEACVRVFGGQMEIAPGGQWEQCRFVTTDARVYCYNNAAGYNTVALCGTGGQSSGWSPDWHVIWSTYQQYNPPSPGYGYRNARQAGPNSATVIYDIYTTWNDQTVQGGAQAHGVTKMDVVEVQDGYKPATNQEAEDMLTDEWEQSCADGNPMCHKAFEEMVEQGAQPEVTDLPLTGPSSVTGGSSTKQTVKPDGTTTTVTITNTYNLTYTDQSVVQTTTITNNKDGETTTEIEEEDTRTACEKDPKAPGCNGEFDTPDGEIPKQTKELTYQAEDLGLGSGTCPADLNVTVGGRSFTVFSYEPGCDLLRDRVKPIVLLLSSIIAFFILMPGGKPE